MPMLKKLFNTVVLGAPALASVTLVGYLGYQLTEMARDLHTNPRLAYAYSDADLAARRKIVLAPARRELSPFALAAVDVGALAPDCTNPRVVAADPALCDWLAYDQKRIARGGLYGAFTRDAQAHFEHMAAYTPPASYLEWDRERAAAAADAIAADPFIRENYLRLKKQNRYENITEARAQYTLKQELAQRTVDILREAYGLPSVPVLLQFFPGVPPEVQGYFIPEKPHILINYNIQTGLTGTYDAMLGTLLHEGRHSIDNDYAYMLLRGEMNRDDVRAPHAAAILLNTKEYISHSDADFIDSGITLLENAYSLQYKERTAFDFGAAMSASVTGRLYCREVDLKCIAAKARRAFDF